MKIISRKDALAQGLKHYFTGKPCHRGHVCLRFVSAKKCTECAALEVKKQYAENPVARAKALDRNKRRFQAILADPDKHERHLELQRVRSARYRKNTRDTKREYKVLKANPVRKAANALRTLTKNQLIKNGGSKSVKTEALLGCSIICARQHLEAQFLPGMSWDNHGEWHIDHIRPCASFDLTDLEQQKECFHYTNLQPLWAADNLRKSDTWQ